MIGYTPTVRRGTCGFHHCGMPAMFMQAPNEAPGVGTWRHEDPAFDYQPSTGRGHAPVSVMERQRMWAIAAIIETRGEQGYTSTRQLPTFYLHPNVQGTLTSERAEKVARDILNPYDDPEVTVHVTAEEVLV